MSAEQKAKNLEGQAREMQSLLDRKLDVAQKIQELRDESARLDHELVRAGRGHPELGSFASAFLAW